MSLNCLTCQSHQRTNSDVDSHNEKCHKLRFLEAERNWSHPLTSPPRDQAWEGSSLAAETSARKRQKADRRLSTGAVVFSRSDLGVGQQQPRLIRSSGMRRDWSFEDLRQIRREGKRKERRHN